MHVFVFAHHEQPLRVKKRLYSHLKCSIQFLWNYIQPTDTTTNMIWAFKLFFCSPFRFLPFSEKCLLINNALSACSYCRFFHPPPPTSILYGIWQAPPSSQIQSSSLRTSFQPFFFFFYPFWSRATRNLRMATFKFAMQGKRAPSCWNESLYLGG